MHTFFALDDTVMLVSSGKSLRDPLTLSLLGVVERLRLLIALIATAARDVEGDQGDGQDDAWRVFDQIV